MDKITIAYLIASFLAAAGMFFIFKAGQGYGWNKRNIEKNNYVYMQGELAISRYETLKDRHKKLIKRYSQYIQRAKRDVQELTAIIKQQVAEICLLKKRQTDEINLLKEKHESEIKSFNEAKNQKNYRIEKLILNNDPGAGQLATGSSQSANGERISEMLVNEHKSFVTQLIDNNDLGVKESYVLNDKEDLRLTNWE